MRSAGDSANYITLDGQVLGTPAFMAPEQATGEVDRIDARADIYALGAILYNMLALRAPVMGKTAQDVLDKVISGRIKAPALLNRSEDPERIPQDDRVPLRIVGLAAFQRRATRDRLRERSLPGVPSTPFPHCPGGHIPGALSAVCMKALARRPENRYATVKELQKDIEAYQNGFATAAERASLLRQLQMLVKRHLKEFTFAGTALLVVLAITTAFIISLERARDEARDAFGRLQDLSRFAAPRFVEAARKEMASGHWVHARKEAEVAIGLDPKSPEAWRIKGLLLLGEQRFDGALEAFAHAAGQEGGALAELTRRYAAKAAANGGKLSASARLSLATAMRERGNPVIAVRLLEGVDMPHIKLDMRVKATMRALEESNPGVAPLDWRCDYFRLWARIHIGEEEMLSDLTPLKGLPVQFLAIRRSSVADLSPLRGMPLVELSVSEAPVADLSPLRGLPLVHLAMEGTRVADLSPLRGLPLKHLNVNRTPVRDLSPLRGMGIESLFIHGTRVADLSVLPTLSLRELWISECECHDLCPLSYCEQLERACIPNLPVDIQCLRNHPALKFLQFYSGTSGWSAVRTPAAQFWVDYDLRRGGGVPLP